MPMTDYLKPILLIEDNPMDVDLTRRAFQKQHIINPIIVTRDGEKALMLMEEWKDISDQPVMILLDLKLPKVNGLEVLVKIKQTPVLKRIPVIVLTSSSDLGDLNKAYDLGVNSYIIKPIDFDEFIEVVGEINKYWCSLNILPR
jgi:CheY-like chemotaxis protein